MTINAWEEYHRKTKDKPPRRLLMEALRFVYTKGEALDLGAGSLNDSKYLLSVGFRHITAVDSNAISGDIIDTMPRARFSYVVETFEKFSFPENKYDLINAQYALPFNPPHGFNKLIERIVAALKSGGVFTGQFFGDRDGWNVKNSGKTFHNIDEAKQLLAGLKIVDFREEEEDKKTVAGDLKHWHVFHFIAVK